MEQSDIDRFFNKVNKTDTCWLWTGCINSSGYGKFTYNKKTLLPHRVSWILAGNTFTDGLEICHSCRNRHCVNPEHLREDTKKANSQDRFRDGTDPTGSKNGRAKLTEQDVIAIRASDKTNAELARMYNVSRANIGHIIKRRFWTHI